MDETPEQKLARATAMRIEADGLWERGHKEESTSLHSKANKLEKEAHGEEPKRKPIEIHGGPTNYTTVDDYLRNIVRAELKKVAELLRKKTKSHTDWGWDPSASDESKAQAVAQDEAREALRQALGEVADALEEIAS